MNRASAASWSRLPNNNVYYRHLHLASPLGVPTYSQQGTARPQQGMWKVLWEVCNIYHIGKKWGGKWAKNVEPEYVIVCQVDAFDPELDGFLSTKILISHDFYRLKSWPTRRY